MLILVPMEVVVCGRRFVICGLWFVVSGGDGQTCRDYVNSQ